MANADDGDAVVGHAAPAEKVARSAVPPEDGREGGRGARRAGWRQPSSQSARETHCGRVSQKARAERARARLLWEKEETNGLGRAGTDTILEEEA